MVRFKKKGAKDWEYGRNDNWSRVCYDLEVTWNPYKQINKREAFFQMMIVLQL